MKKIIVFESSCFISGGQKMTLDIVKNLKEKFSFIFLIPGEGELSNELRKMNISYFTYGSIYRNNGRKNLKSVIEYFRKTKYVKKVATKVIREENIDLIYCPGPTTLAWGASVGLKTGINVVWHIHHYFKDFKTKFLLSIYSKFSSVKKIICVSEFVKNQIKSNSWQKKSAIFFNPIKGIKENNFIKKAPENKILNVAHIGDIQKGKNQWFTIKALNKIAKNSSLRINCYFAGKIVEKPYYEKLCKLINKNENLNIDFLGKVANVDTLYHDIDAVIIPSVEGFSLVALESALNGVRIIGSDKGGLKEVLSSLNYGLVYAHNNVNDFCKKFDLLFNTEFAPPSLDNFAFAKYINKMEESFKKW